VCTPVIPAMQKCKQDSGLGWPRRKSKTLPQKVHSPEEFNPSTKKKGWGGKGHRVPQMSSIWKMIQPGIRKL
jgi:hypothetical protein